MFILAISPGTGFDATRWQAVLASGVDGLMLREKQLEAKPLLELALRVQDLAPSVELWVNGRLDVALAAGCGLHAPEAYPDIPGGLVTLSRPLHAEGQWPLRAAAQQLLVGPIFPVPGKGAAWGAPRLHRFLDGVEPGPRLLALGGVDDRTALSLRHPRLDGLALMRALWDAPAPARVMAALRAAWA